MFSRPMQCSLKVNEGMLMNWIQYESESGIHINNHKREDSVAEIKEILQISHAEFRV